MIDGILVVMHASGNLLLMGGSMPNSIVVTGGVRKCTNGYIVEVHSLTSSREEHVFITWKDVVGFLTDRVKEFEKCSCGMFPVTDDNCPKHGCAWNS